MAVFAVAACGGGAGTFAMLRQQNHAQIPPPRLVAVSPEQMTALVGSVSEKPYALVGFMDYQCPPCRATQPTLRALVQNYPGKLQFSAHNKPLPMHVNALRAATAAEAAREQNKFESMHDALLGGGSLDEPEIQQIAKKIGLNTGKFESSRKQSALKRVQDDLITAESLHVDGTPTFFLCSMRDGKVWLLSSLAQVKDLMK